MKRSTKKTNTNSKLRSLEDLNFEIFRNCDLVHTCNRSKNRYKMLKNNYALTHVLET